MDNDSRHRRHQCPVSCLVLAGLIILLPSGVTHADDGCEWDDNARKWREIIRPIVAANVQRLHVRLSIPLDYGKRTGLPAHPLASSLESSSPGKADSVLLSPTAARQWQKMREAAAEDGVELGLTSGYRSIEYQADLIARARRKMQGDMERILSLYTAPGHSEHHSGDAIDIETNEVNGPRPEFANTEAFAWLERNAGDYCFELSYPKDNEHGISFEPWHWRLKRIAP